MPILRNAKLRTCIEHVGNREGGGKYVQLLSCE